MQDKNIVTLKQAILSTENMKNCQLKEESFRLKEQMCVFVWKFTPASEGVGTW